MNQTNVDSKKGEIEICCVTMQPKESDRGNLQILSGNEGNLVPDFTLCEAKEGAIYKNDIYRSDDGQVIQYPQGSYKILEEREAIKAKSKQYKKDTEMEM